MKRHVLIYGLIGGILIAVLKWTEYRFLVIEHSIEIYGGLTAAIFAVLGIWLGFKLTGTKQRVVVKEVLVPAGEPFVPDERKREDLGIRTTDRFKRAYYRESALGDLLTDAMRAYMKAAGRPLSAVGIEGRFAYGIGGPTEWAKRAREWSDLGATHLSVNTMGAGLSPRQHIEAILKMKPSLDGL